MRYTHVVTIETDDQALADPVRRMVLIRLAVQHGLKVDAIAVREQHAQEACLEAQRAWAAGESERVR